MKHFNPRGIQTFAAPCEAQVVAGMAERILSQLIALVRDFDPNHLIPNPPDLTRDLDGKRSSKDGTVEVRVLVLAP